MEVIDIIGKYAPGQEIAEDAFIARDLRILGGDGAELLDELEARFGVDLRPLIERGPLEQNSILHKIFGAEPRKSGVDVSVAEIISFVTLSRQ